MAIVEARLTPLDPLVALGELMIGYEATFDRRPSEPEAKILWAGTSHETGKFGRMKNFGVAGVKATAGWKGDVAIYRTTEGAGASARPVDQAFRAYRSAREGFADWLDMLRRGYPMALKGARMGDVEYYVDGLQQGWGRGAKYFTADPSAYLAGVWRNLRELNASYVVAWADLTSKPSGDDYA